MRNRFMRRGIILMIFGIAFNLVGYLIRDEDWGYYGWAMIAGTAMFGIGFLSLLYSFMRKIEVQGIKEERAVEAERKELLEEVNEQNPTP